MDLAELQRKLMAAARAHPPEDGVPYAFEQRILARLQAWPAPEDWAAFWSRALWRAAAPCVAIMVLLGAWAWFASATNGSNTDLSQDIENTVLAAADQEPAADL
jgi:hypothetical protein